jgi:hypothetical protein
MVNPKHGMEDTRKQMKTTCAVIRFMKLVVWRMAFSFLLEERRAVASP